MFFLSHHHPDALHRCYRIGSVWLCARCVGLYVGMFVTFAIQVTLAMPLFFALDPTFAVLLTLPSLVDWAIGQFWPRASSNLVRSTTGALLGVALGRTLFVHFHTPFPIALKLQMILVTAMALAVILISYTRRVVR